MGSAFDDLLVGDAAGSVLIGLAGDDLLYGNDSQEAADAAAVTRLSGGAGSNALYGGSAYNLFLSGDAAGGLNQIWGGASGMAGVEDYTNNTLSYAAVEAGRSVYVDLLNGHNAYLNDGSQNNGAYALEDSILDVPNVVGSAGGDVIIADNGTDRLTGAGGGDSLYAGTGQDTFVYTAYADSNLVAGYDTIVGFKLATDLIDLSALNTDAGHLVIATSGTANSVYVEQTPGTFNAATDLAISVNTTTPGGLSLANFVFANG
jgi:Ca2+-binding RTX toxin-like protein